MIQSSASFKGGGIFVICGLMARIRVDKLLVAKGLAPTREKAQALVMAGCVFAGGVKVEKPGLQIDDELNLEVRGRDHPYVSRGGVKLMHALDSFGVSVEGRICMDVGVSTGGFADCLLARGAAKIYAIDVGYGQLAWKIAKDPRVVVIERTNIRNMSRDYVSEAIAIAVIDVSFISLTLVLPAVDCFLTEGSSIIALIKPQFEVGRELVGKGGIVKDPSSHELAIQKVREAGYKLGLVEEGIVDSPILGTKGNREFLIYFQKS